MGKKDGAAMERKKLGFGAMRLPVLNGNHSVVDLAAVTKLVDIFLKGGCSHFDTSYIYS